MSLAAELAKLSNPAPVFQDKEIDDDDAGATLCDRFNEDFDEAGFLSSSLRKKAAPLLADLDERYAGKKMSRHMLDSDEFDKELNEQDDDIESAGSDASDQDHEIDEDDSGMSADDTSDDGDVSDNMEQDDDEDDDARDVNGGKSDTFQTIQREEIKNFSRSGVDGDIEKGASAKAQLALWDNFLQCRIKMQKVLHLVNQLPQGDVAAEVASHGGDDVMNASKDSSKILKVLLDQLFAIQTMLLLNNSDTAAITGEKGIKRSAGDEEIPSDSDEEIAPKSHKIQIPASRKIKASEYPEELRNRHKKFKSYRDETIQKWHDKTKLSTGKMSSKSFAAFDISALTQIDQILSDKDRLLKRTQLKRSDYKVIGKVEEKRNIDEEDDRINDEGVSLRRRDNLKEYDEEIFDDDDFYHQLLREFIERKTSDSNDPSAISRHILEVQKLRGKVKKNVDTKASKGRKIRYDVHKKLVNFMAPMDLTSWTEESKNDLFSSLFK